ncbi:MAG: LacI family transcriptional regulator [Lachnospiraceae bacterium]|nr:LacI family transcriptional regulator [Lachnospiraceae bacterium]
MITQKDVARLAGVSISTVSRVLNKSALVDKETKITVESAIKELDYKPNLVAYGLRAQKSKLIGILMPELDHNAYGQFTQRIEEISLSRGYGLLVGLHHNECETEKRLIDEFQRRNIDGLILSPVVNSSDSTHHLQNCIHVPAVLFQNGRSCETMSNVEIDNYQAGRIAAEYLLSLGHKQIFCTAGPADITFTHTRLQGFLERLREAGIRLGQNQIFSCEFNYQKANYLNGIEAVAAFFDSKNSQARPTAIWAHNDNVAAGIIRGLHLRNIRIPEEVSVVGMDNMSITEMLYPSLTTIGQPFAAMAEKAVELLLENINFPDESIAEEVLVPPKLIIRESSGICSTPSSHPDTFIPGHR